MILERRIKTQQKEIERLNKLLEIADSGFDDDDKTKERYTNEIKELKSLCLWSARRLKHQQYKDFAYDQFENITGEKWKDYDDTI